MFVHVGYVAISPNGVFLPFLYFEKNFNPWCRNISFFSTAIVFFHDTETVRIVTFTPYDLFCSMCLVN